jgi:hypothetical protein
MATRSDFTAESSNLSSDVELDPVEESAIADGPGMGSPSSE